MFAPLPTPHHVQSYVFNTCMVPWSCHYKLDSEQSPNLKVDFATQSLLTLSPVPPPIYAVSLSHPLECYTNTTSSWDSRSEHFRILQRRDLQRVPILCRVILHRTTESHFVDLFG